MGCLAGGRAGRRWCLAARRACRRGACVAPKSERVGRGTPSALRPLPSALRLPRPSLQPPPSCPPALPPSRPPTLQWRARGAAANPEQGRRASGPTKVQHLDIVAVSWPATPKSASLTSPVRESSTFAALMSLCIFASECKYSRPCSTSCMTAAMHSSSIAPTASIMSYDGRAPREGAGASQPEEQG